MRYSLFSAGMALLGSVTAAPLAKRAALTQVSDFGSSSPGIMYIYVPDTLADNPPIVVAIHYCSGTAQAYYTGSPYAHLADQYGFIVIYPESPYSGTCHDVASQATLTHNGGGESNAIADMVTYTIEKYSADASQVFVTGSSSGAMMTNVMSATYPELFKAATAYNGVPAGCFAITSQTSPPATGSEPGWNSTCAQGQVIEDQAYWTAVAEGMYPGYTGSRPRFLAYHGSTDTTLYPQNFQETLKEWTGVFGLDYDSPDSTGTTSKGYELTTYGVTDANPDGTVVGVYAIGVGHTVPIDGDSDMKFFGLGPYAGQGGTGGATGGDTTASTSSAAASSAVASTPASSAPAGASSAVVVSPASSAAVTTIAAAAPSSTASAAPSVSLVIPADC